MVKVFISRLDDNVAWGFRLQGGFEYGEPLTFTNIVPNSPADGKIDPGDTLIEVAGNNATYMTHRDALELIQCCGNALFLNLQKVGHPHPSGPTQLWRSSEQPPLSDYTHPAVPLYNASPPSPPIRVTSIPRAPIFDADLIANAITSLKSLQPITDTHQSHDPQTEFSNIPAVLAKSFGRPGGPKPFTYIPGGLDLSKIHESARIRRQRESRSNSKDSHEFDQIMNRRMIVPTEHMDQHHYTSSNPIQPFSYATSQPTPPRKSIQHDTDVITQTRSFQMLQGWISDKEKTAPSVVSPTSINKSAVTPAVFNEQNNIDRRASSGGISSLPSRSFRYLQDQYNDDNNPTTSRQVITSGTNPGARRSSDVYTASRTFIHSQDQHDDASQQIPVNRSQAINNRNDLLEIYNKPPASFRQREPEAKRFTGSTNPSRSFRFLQMMTENDQQNDLKPVSGYIKPQQLVSNEHPPHSFKYTQDTSGEQQSTINRTLSNEINSTDIGESDF